MNGLNSFGLVFGFQDTQNYYIAHVFPGFGGSAFRLEKVVSGGVTIVFAGSSNNHNVGFTWNAGDDNALVTPDALRIQRVGNTFDAFAADSSGGGWLSFSQSTWTDNTFPAAPSLVGFGERFDDNMTTTGARFAVFGSGATGIDSVLASTDLTLALSLVGTAPSLGCVGFEPPMAGGAVKVKKNRALPHKAQLLDDNSQPINDLDIAAAPVIQVIFDDGVLPAEDVSDDALSAGHGTEGNQFEFLGSKWQFNLKTKNYSAAGTYTTTMESGDEAEYLIDPTCEATFVIN